MSKLAISQTGYPKKIVYNKDTVIAVTLGQMQRINKEHITLLQYKELSDSLGSYLDTCRQSFSIYKDNDSVLKAQITLQEQAIVDRDKVIVSFEYTDKEYRKEITRLKRQKLLTIVGSGIILLLGYILIL